MVRLVRRGDVSEMSEFVCVLWSCVFGVELLDGTGHSVCMCLSVWM